MEKTRFHDWWESSPMTDLELAEHCRKLDPRGKGMCARTIRRTRYGKPCSPEGVALLMAVTGLAFEDFLPRGFSRKLAAARKRGRPEVG
jgi:hypothetical protein